MDRFIGDLRRCTHQLKEGWPAFEGVTLRYSSRHVDEDEVLQCDRYLRVHWKNFVKALGVYEEKQREEQRVSSSYGEEWWLSKIEVPKEIRNLLEPILTTRTNIRILFLDRNEFGRDGVDFLCNLVERNSYLKRVSFHNNPIECDDDFTRFCEAISKHPSLEQLTLENVGLNGNEDKLSKILDAGKNLECLGLSNDGIGSRRATKMITQFLAASNVKTIYLRDNDFRDESADLFASVLTGTDHLRVVDLSGNQFTALGKRTIYNSVFDTSSLSAAIDSNHTCAVYIDGSESQDKLEVINGMGAPEENKHQKVFTMLYAATDEGHLGNLLKGVPPGLMPDVLDYLQDFYLDDIPRGVKKHAMEALRQYTLNNFDEEFSRQTIFTVMFEVLRSWNLPLLYTNL